MAEAKLITPKLGRYGLFLGVLLIGLYAVTHQNYLLFHSLAEIFSVLVAWSIFVIAWNSREFINNTYLLFISIAYFFVGGIDLLHTLAYSGMGVFPDAGSNLPTQLWIAARSLQAISLFIAPFLLHRRVNPSAIFLGYLGITTILLSSIFVWDIFPTCYVDGSGLTPFKIISEYIICTVLLVTVPLMISRRHDFDPVILRSLIASVLVTIASELCFTLYVGLYDFQNMVGHLLKIVAFYLVYRVLIAKALKEPYSLYFRAFRQNEIFLRQTNEFLESRIRERTADLAATNEALRKSEARYRILSENFPNGAVLLFDRDLRYTLADGNGLTEVGLSKSMLEGKTIWEVLPPETCQMIEPAYRNTLAGQAVTQEIPFRDRVYLLQSMPIYNKSNEIIAGLITTQNITDRKRIELALRDRLEFEQLISSISTQFVNLTSDELEPGIQQALEQITTFTGFDRSFLVVFSEDETTGHITHQVNQPGIAPIPEHWLVIPSAQFSWWMEQLKQFSPIEISNLADLPETANNERQALESLQIQSIVVVPVVTARSLVGYIGFASIQSPKTWIASEVALLKFVGELFANALQRHKTEIVLRQQAQVLHHIHDGVIVATQTGEITRWNQGAERLYGYTSAEAIGQHISIIYPQEQNPTFLEDNILAPLQDKGTHSLEVVRRTKTGEIIYVNLSVSSICNREGEITGFIAYSLDISDRKQMEASVRESESKYRMLFDANPHPMWVYSLETLRFLAVNQAAIEHYGYSRNEFLAMTLCDIHPPDDVPALLDNVSRVTTGIDNAGIWHHCKRDGTVIGVEITSHALTFAGQKTELVLAHDITEQLQAKRALEESEERWQLALRGNNDGIWDWNPKTNKVFFSSRWKEMLGYADEDIGDSVDEWTSRVHPDDLDWVMSSIQDHFQQKTPFYIAEHRLRCKDGNYKWILDRGQALWDDQGHVLRMAGSHTDVTDRHNMEEDLRDSEATFRAFLEAASEAIIVTNNDGNIVVFNTKAQEIFGYTSEEALGHTVEFLLPERFRTDHVHHRHHYRHEPMNRPMKVSKELQALRKDGSIFPIEAGLGTVDTQHGRFVITFITDITEQKQAQDELDRFFSLSLEPLCIAGFDGYFKRLNPAFETILGYPTEQILSTPILNWVHSGDRQRTQQELEQLLQGSTTIKFQNRYQCQDGSYKWLSWSAIPVLSEQLIYAAARDITQQKHVEEQIRQLNAELEQRVEERTEELRLANEQLRQSQEIYRQMFELNQAVKLLIDPDDGALVDANSAAAEFYGYPLETLKQMKISDLNVMSKSQIADAMQQTVSNTKGYWIFRHRIASGDIRDVEVYSSRLNFRGKEMLHSIIHDITERKQAEEKLRQSNERISLANAELARATRLKDEFLANMSHELRTPLNSILGLSEALQEEVYGSLTDKQRRSLSTIEQSGQHLLELINDVLDLSKVESGRMELQLTVTSVQNLCSSSLTFVKQQAHHKHLKLSHHINDPITEVVVDERRLRQVLINLLSNAVKFTPDGGEVRLEVDHNEANETVQFSVIDTGIGIEPDNMEQLFRPFVQLDSALSRRYAGTGLGLALVRRITELHGGSVTLESTVGEGSCFTITLPWRSSPHEDPTNELWQEDVMPHLSQALVVEDSEPAARQVSRYLQELGASVVIHPQGEGAVAEALRNRPDVIILDLLLPYLSGWEVLSQLKADPRTRHIPVLILSVMDERSQALELGAAEALVKPLSRQRLRATLSQILQGTDDSSADSSDREVTPTTLIVTPDAPRIPRILLTDDNEANITTVMDYLKAHGYDVILARNGFEAVDLTRTEAPDLILMDIQMPEMDGLEATRRIRDEKHGSKIPILAMTALAMPGDRDRCLAIGMNDYLPKPVSLKNLLKAITQHLQQSPTSGRDPAASHD